MDISTFNKRQYQASFIFSILICLVTSGMAQQKVLTLNEQEYFEMPGLNVMVFHDFYPEGHQGGVTIIQNGVRVASNGDLRLEPAPGQWQPVPKMGERFVDPNNNIISVPCFYPNPDRNGKGFNPIKYPDLQFQYKINVKAEGTSIRITVDLDKPLPVEWIGKVGFNLELFPGTLFGKTYYMDDAAGLFPRQLNGPMNRDEESSFQIKPLAEGEKLTIVPECN
ncbi:MAG: glycoside hydrolase, partial [bacterium]